MGMVINISNELASSAKAYSRACNRSMAKQVEYWSRIGKVSEENPDLTYEDIKGVLLSIEEKDLGLVEEYKFD